MSNYTKTIIRLRFVNNILLLTEREGRTGEYWPEVVAVRSERSEVRAETTEGQYSPVRLELARLVSSLLYGTRAILYGTRAILAYGKIPTKKEPIRTLGFAVPYNNGEYSPRLRLGQYSPIFTSPSANNCQFFFF